MLVERVQSPAQFSLVSHFYVDLLIQTQPDQVQGLLDRYDLILKGCVLL